MCSSTEPSVSPFRGSTHAHGYHPFLPRPKIEHSVQPAQIADETPARCPASRSCTGLTGLNATNHATPNGLEQDRLLAPENARLGQHGLRHLLSPPEGRPRCGLLSSQPGQDRRLEHRHRFGRVAQGRRFRGQHVIVAVPNVGYRFVQEIQDCGFDRAVFPLMVCEPFANLGLAPAHRSPLGSTANSPA